jgi:endonuclease I
MTKSILIIALVLTIKLNAQPTVYADSVVFPQILTGFPDSISISIVNPTDETIELKLKNLKPVYNLSDTLFLIGPNDSNMVWIKYSPNQNVIDNDLLLITASDSTIGKVIALKGSAIFGDGYDAATFNLYDVQLKNALTQLVSGHTSLGYNLARDKMFMEIDNKRVNGQGASQNTVECVYTGRLAVGYTDRTDAFNNYNFNTEHTWPQSTFSQNEPMRSDLFHLFPTDVNANAIRSNYPFGNVVSGVTWDSAGSKLGRNYLNQIVFEPRDIHKGDVSRSMFYFMIRYPQNYGGFFTQVQENDFREWNIFDPVGPIESARNNAIASLQQRRNPFIDHPEFADRIYSFATNNPRPVLAELDLLPLKINFDSTAIGDSSFQFLYLISKGSAHLTIDSITISDNRFTAEIFNSEVKPYSYQKFPIKFEPDLITDYTATLTVFSNGGQKQVVLNGIGKDNTVGVDEEFFTPIAFSLEQNYPNPFNPATVIRYQVPVSSFVTLKVYDVLGREVAILVNEEKPVGSYEVKFIASAIPSGVYFYNIQSGSFVQTRKMILNK